MLQDRITVDNGSEHDTFDGTEVVQALRAAYACQPAAKNAARLADWIKASPEFKVWCSNWRAMAGETAAAPCACSP